MASYTAIEAEPRLRPGKGGARATRRAGRVPGILYGARQQPELISLEPRTVLRLLHAGGWRSRLFELSRGGEAPVRALMRDVQLHPVTDQPEHVDFQRLAPGEEIRVTVTVHFTGEATSPGLKRGGVLNVVRHTIEVWADPDRVPQHFEADLSALDINDNIRWHELAGTEGLRPTVTDRDFVVATVAAPTVVEAEPEAPAPVATPAAAPAKGGKPATKGAAAPAAKAPAAKAPAAKAPAAKAGAKGGKK